jgi:uncharacterized protein YecT (DUF1311 family)
MRLHLVAVLCLAPLAASAQDVDCSNQITQLDMNMCAYKAFEAADAELNRVYAETIAYMQAADRDYPPPGDSEEARLRKAQRAWVAFRDANCDSAGFQMRGGSAEPLIVNGCLHAMTEERIAELRSLTETY